MSDLSNQVKSSNTDPPSSHGAIINPYAARRAAPPVAMYTGPLFTPAVVPTATTAVTLGGEGSSYSGPEERSAWIDSVAIGGDPADTSFPFQSRHADTSPDTVQDGPRTSGSTDLPQWQRLPSRHVSFQSAEILTLTECADLLRSPETTRCLDAKSDSQERTVPSSKSVSVTGILRYKVTHDASNRPVDEASVRECDQSDEFFHRVRVSLVLSDPLASISLHQRPPYRREQTPNRHATSQCSHTGELGRRVTLTPAARTNRTNTLLHVSKAGRTPHSVPPAANKASVPRLGKRTFRMVVSKANSGRSSLGGILKSRRRTLEPAQPLDPMQRLARELQGTSKDSAATVWVQVDPRVVPVETIQVGQLVTVFGEVMWPRSSEGAGPGSFHVDDSTVASTDGKEATFDQDSSETTNTMRNDKERKSYFAHMGWIQARILRDATGTNMALYTKALMMRRQLLEKVHAS